MHPVWVINTICMYLLRVTRTTCVCLVCMYASSVCHNTVYVCICRVCHSMYDPVCVIEHECMYIVRVVVCVFPVCVIEHCMYVLSVCHSMYVSSVRHRPGPSWSHCTLTTKISNLKSPCSVVHCGAVWCSVVQCGAVWCSVVQCSALWCSVSQCVMQCAAVWCSVLQCICAHEIPVI